MVYPTSGCYYGNGYGKLLQQGMNLQNITVTTQYKYIPEEDDYDEYCDELYVLSGGTATNIAVDEAAFLEVYSGGTVVNLNLGDARGTVSSGGKITGRITFLYADELSSYGGMSFFMWVMAGSSISTSRAPRREPPLS